MNKRLQAELWEVQVVLYWILGFLLLRFSDTTFAHDLGYFVVGWGCFGFIGVITKTVQAAIEERLR